MNFLHEGFLRSNALTLAKRVKHGGLFNIILIFGATRSGKSTLGFNIGAEIAQYCGVPFGKSHITFKAEEIVNWASKGTKFGVYMLDEGAFDVLGEEWYKKANRDLRKFIMVAAKYNQTLIVNIPEIKDLHQRIVKDYHARGFCTSIKYDRNNPKDENKWQRGFVKGYKGKDLYDFYERSKKGESIDFIYKTQKATLKECRFPKDYSKVIDDAIYQEMKDKAIEELTQELDNDPNDVRYKIFLLVEHVKRKYKMSNKEACKVMDIHVQTLQNWKGKFREPD